MSLFSFLLQAAKEKGALQEAKSKLEKEVEELTQRLEVEKRMRVNIFILTFKMTTSTIICN